MFHINDIDKIRIEFYNDMKNEDKRIKLYKIENNIFRKGLDEYYKYIDSAEN